MKSWVNFFKVIIFIIGVIVLSFNVLLYNSFERQKNEINAISEQQKAEAQVNSNKYGSFSRMDGCDEEGVPCR